MKFEELENKGLIRRIKINFKQIYNFLSRSKQDLQTAKLNLSIDEAWSYAIAYHAMLRAGRSLMMSFGFRPLFDRMRRKRHDFIYEPNRPIPRQEADQAIADAEELVKQIWHVVKKKDPQ